MKAIMRKRKKLKGILCKQNQGIKLTKQEINFLARQSDNDSKISTQKVIKL